MNGDTYFKLGKCPGGFFLMRKNDTKPVESYDGLTFIANENNSSVKLSFSNATEQLTIEYRLNSSPWQDYTLDEVIDLNLKDKLVIRNKDYQDTLSHTDTQNNPQFTMTGSISAYGSVDYLYRNDGAPFEVKEYTYCRLFKDCTALEKAPDLPSIYAEGNAYSFMFQGCTNLIAGPKVLPATTVDTGTYTSMFDGCSNLTVPPIIAYATTKISAATGVIYGFMFNNCSSLSVTDVETPGAIEFLTLPDIETTILATTFIGTAGPYVENGSVDRTRVPGKKFYYIKG